MLETECLPWLEKSPVRRTIDRDYINSIVNASEVLPWVKLPDQDFLDISELIDDKNIVLAFDGGCFIFVYHEPGLYEVHSQALKNARGKTTLLAARAAAKELFLTTECVEIVTKVPVNNLAAKGLTLAMHFSMLFSRKSWPTVDGMIDCGYYGLKIDEWIKTHDFPLRLGRWFHNRLQRLKEHNHEDEEIHDRYVGASLGMALSGQPHKAEWLYNRWARFAGYETVELLNLNPLVIDIREAIVQIDTDLRILKCR